ncbi:unnamed protein product [Allacma fusca]|uniref:Uncharacterized protein n=1 Tax=Allacma fusca TaxID=39272 RepID=A0A8J2J911_9HEXA|nr:unnamed protein product [Allacma fusca]
MKRQKLIVIFGFALFSQACSLRTTPSSLPSDADIIREVISYLKDRHPSPRQEDDDDDTTRRPIFPGVAQILLGVVTGDIRRVIEDGIFSFLPKEAQTHALSFFHNIIGRTTPSPTKNTTKAATTTSSGKTVMKLITTELPPATSTTLRSKSTLRYHKVTRIPTYRIKSRTSFTLTPSTLATTPSLTSYTATTEDAEITDPDPDPDPDPESEEGELASRLEEALRPYLPVNPDDAIPQDTPKFISKSRI